MKITKRTTIRLEKHEKSVVRVRANFRMFCEVCGVETEHLTVAQFAWRSEKTERKVFQMTELGSLHSVDCADGRILVCTGKFT
jgi:hypothetical protein